MSFVRDSAGLVQGKPQLPLSRIHNMTHAPLDDARPLTVFYNGACPICRAEIIHYQGLADRHGVTTLAWRDLSQEPDALATHDLTPTQAKRRLYTADSEGALFCGIDSFIAIWDRLPRYRWLARLARLPGLYGIAGFMYERLAVPALAWLNRRRAQKSRAR